MTSSNIKQIADKIVLLLKSDPQIAKQIEYEVNKYAHDIFSKAITDDKGYCTKFNIVQTSIVNILKHLKLDKNTVYEAFKKDWKFTSATSMYAYPVYHVLLLLYYVFLQLNKEDAAKNCLFIVLCNIWNGRITKFFPKGCDPEIMDYAIQNLIRKNSVIYKYNCPANLLRDYYVNTLHTTYSNRVKNNINDLIRLFRQCWSRLQQLFVQSFRLNLETGKPIAQSGLAVYYYRAQQEGAKIATAKTIEGFEKEAALQQKLTEDWIGSVTDKVASQIVITINPQYPQNLIDYIYRNTNVKREVIDKLLRSLHDNRYYDLIKNILALLISPTGVKQESDICTRQFASSVYRLINSKAVSGSIKQLRMITIELLDKILADKMELNPNDININYKVQLVKVLQIGLLYNLRKIICSKTQ